MKKYLTLAVLGLAIASFTTTGFAGAGCGSKHSDDADGGEAKDGDKTEESTQS